jgi:hypothetical protein
MTATAPINYSAHGTAKVAIVAIPTLVGNRLVYLSQKGEYSWAVRDFIFGEMLRSGDSELTLTQVEALVTCSEKGPYRSVNRTNEWRQELIGSSRREFGARYDASTPPSRNFGKWKRL